MKIKTLKLTESEQKELLLGFRRGKSHCFRMRCRMILLKSEGLSALHVREQTEMTIQSVHNWVKRFESEGIKALHTRPGQGRKPIIDCSAEAAVRKAIGDGHAKCEDGQGSLAEVNR